MVADHTVAAGYSPLQRANVAGFAWVESVDVEKHKVTLLVPAPLTMTSLYLLAGSITWSQAVTPK